MMAKGGPEGNKSDTRTRQKQMVANEVWKYAAPIAREIKEHFAKMAIVLGPDLNAFTLQIAMEISAQVAKTALKLAEIEEHLRPGHNTPAEAGQLIIMGIAEAFQEHLNVSVSRRNT